MNDVFDYEVDIEIDELTDCVYDRRTNNKYDTEYQLVTIPITKKESLNMQKEGWKFDWSKPFKEGLDVYELKIEGLSKPQGFIALQHDIKGGYTYVGLVESAPWNIGKNGQFEGVGGNLFAIACKESFAVGNDGYVQFVSKTNLVEHYQNKIYAKSIGTQRMYIDTIGATKLINQYF